MGQRRHFLLKWTQLQFVWPFVIKWLDYNGCTSPALLNSNKAYAYTVTNFHWVYRIIHFKMKQHPNFEHDVGFNFVVDIGTTCRTMLLLIRSRIWKTNNHIWLETNILDGMVKGPFTTMGETCKSWSYFVGKIKARYNIWNAFVLFGSREHDFDTFDT